MRTKFQVIFAILLSFLLVIFSILSYWIFQISSNIQSTKKEIVNNEEKEVQNVLGENIDRKEYKVLSVVDGDTIKVEEVGTLRLIGIDTPETVDPRKPVQCYGVEASNMAKQLLQNKSVTLEYDETQGKVDKYGRTLAYVYTEDNKLFNLEMIKNGYAFEYTYSIPYKYQKEFKEAQREARELKIGLWSDKCENNIPTQTDTKYICDCTKTCTQIKSCDEAQYQLKTCGCTKRDGDNDGFACSGEPLNCN